MALSTMQPSITFKPIARAVWIIASAPRMPPVFASFTLTPSMQPLSGGRSLATRAVFVGDDRDVDALADRAQPVRIPGRNGLLAKFDLVPLHFAQRRDRLIDGPAFIGVDANRAAITRANRGDHLDVVRGRAPADLHFEDRILRRFVDLAQHLVRLRDPDRK